MVSKGVPVRFMLGGGSLDIVSGKVSAKGTNVIHQIVYWNFTKDTAKKIAKWLGARPSFDKSAAEGGKTAPMVRLARMKQAADIRKLLYPLLDSLQPFVKDYRRFIGAFADEMNELTPMVWELAEPPNVDDWEGGEVEGKLLYRQTLESPAEYAEHEYTYPSQLGVHVTSSVSFRTLPKGVVNVLKQHIADPRGFEVAFHDLLGNSKSAAMFGKLILDATKYSLRVDGIYETLGDVLWEVQETADGEVQKENPDMSVSWDIDGEGGRLDKAWFKLSGQGVVLHLRVTLNVAEGDVGAEFTERYGSKSAATGNYGFTKAMQKDIDVASRRIAKAATTIARKAHGKDARIADFLVAHAKRGKSMSARVLITALQEMAPKLAADVEMGRWASPAERLQELREASGTAEPTPQGKEAKYGMYGYRSKTSKLGLGACSDLRHEAGRIGSDLHRRRHTAHTKISEYLKTHCKESGCDYSKLLMAGYPAADMKFAAMPEPESIDDWIAWED
jgi:hypothetical protein